MILKTIHVKISTKEEYTMNELELKYEIKESLSLYDILKLFIDNGFLIESTETITNNDDYYDTNNLDLYKSNNSLRIREKIKNGISKYKSTLKINNSVDSIYTNRLEIEDDMESKTLEELKRNLDGKIDLNNIETSPILNVTTYRTNVVLSKNDKRICLSLDNTIYTNYKLDSIISNDEQLEIEALDKDSESLLNEINNLLKQINKLSIIKDSKYKRGINKTTTEYNKVQKSL